MKRQKQRHQHNESFSVILIPNTGGESRQFHLTRLSFRLYVGVLVFILLATAGAAAWTTYHFSRQEGVRSQLAGQEEKIEALEAQVQTLEQEKEEKEKKIKSEKEESRVETNVEVKPDGSRVLVMTRTLGGMATSMSIELSKPTSMPNDAAGKEGLEEITEGMEKKGWTVPDISQVEEQLFGEDV